jgi:hypothetical protein
MGMMKFDIPHTLPKEEVRKRLDQLLQHWAHKHGVTTTWSGDGAKLAGKVMGFDLDARFTVTDKVVQGEGTDPGLLLRGQVKSYLQKKVGSVLDPSKSLDQVKRELA